MSSGKKFQSPSMLASGHPLIYAEEQLYSNMLVQHLGTSAKFRNIKIYRVAIVKFTANNGGGNGTSCREVEIRTSL